LQDCFQMAEIKKCLAAGHRLKDRNIRTQKNCHEFNSR
jgi:hypothetical protein